MKIQMIIITFARDLARVTQVGCSETPTTALPTHPQQEKRGRGSLVLSCAILHSSYIFGVVATVFVCSAFWMLLISALLSQNSLLHVMFYMPSNSFILIL